MKLLVQEYLRSGKKLEQLKEEHGVKSSITNGKVCLNYDQIDAKESDPLACQCRGLVLREGSWDVVAAPFFRFFNLGQSTAADIDWYSAAFEEKMDGSCIIVYFDKVQNRWCAGTRGRCEADADAHGSGKTFAELVDETARQNIWLPEENPNSDHPITKREDLNLQYLMNDACPKYTYIFELCTPINRVVCKYDDFSMTLLGVRNNNTLEEYSPKDHIINFGNTGVKLPKLYEFSSSEDMVEVIREWNPEFHEGVVVKDINFNRIKVKNPAYVAYNHMRDSLATSFRGCMEVILLKKDDDVIHMMPDIIADRIRALKPAVSKLFNHLNADYERLKDIEDMKEFALEAQKCIWPGPLFAMKRGKIKDLDSFIFNKNSGSHIQTSMVDNILSLCKNVDPSIADLM